MPAAPLLLGIVVRKTFPQGACGGGDCASLVVGHQGNKERRARPLKAQKSSQWPKTFHQDLASNNTRVKTTLVIHGPLWNSIYRL